VDSFVDERDYRLIDNDKYTFFVLGKIMGGECRFLQTDHERMIICHSERPYPVWIWTPDDLTVNEKESIYKIINDEFSRGKGFTFNLKYDLAEYIIDRAKADGIDFSINMNMFAYDCPEPVKPVYEVDGRIHKCTMEDIDEIVEIYNNFSVETGIEKLSAEEYREKAEYLVKNNNKLFFWEDESRRHVASCTYRPNGKLASLGLVYTRMENRRKHYAENLVYLVSKMAHDEGYLPMLYTNADYVASNACYKKVGYVLRGKLCTIAT